MSEGVGRSLVGRLVQVSRRRQRARGMRADGRVDGRGVLRRGVQDVRAYETADGSKAVCGQSPGRRERRRSCSTSTMTCSRARRSLGDAPWALTERNGRWYGRGAADCKGNLDRAPDRAARAGRRAAGDGEDRRRGIRGAGHRWARRRSCRRIWSCCAPTRSWCATRERRRRRPRGDHEPARDRERRVTVRTLQSAVHSGMFGGAAPDALAALIRMLATLRDDRGNTTIRGLDTTQTWPGAAYSAEHSVRTRMCLTVSTFSGRRCRTWCGRGLRRPSSASTARRWSARPPLSSHEARARINLRVPPGMDPKTRSALIAISRRPRRGTSRSSRAGGLRLAFPGATGGPAFEAMPGAWPTPTDASDARPGRLHPAV